MVGKGKKGKGKKGLCGRQQEGEEVFGCYIVMVLVLVV